MGVSSENGCHVEVPVCTGSDTSEKTRDQSETLLRKENSNGAVETRVVEDPRSSEGNAGSFLYRWKHDRLYRKKYILTLAYIASFLTLVSLLITHMLFNIPARKIKFLFYKDASIAVEALQNKLICSALIWHSRKHGCFIVPRMRRVQQSDSS